LSDREEQESFYATQDAKLEKGQCLGQSPYKNESPPEPEIRGKSPEYLLN
jgi:hypothetical protein